MRTMRRADVPAGVPAAVRADVRAERRRARWQVMTGLVAPATAVLLLPDPPTAAAHLHGALPAEVLGGVVVVIASMTAWFLLAWALLVSIAAILSGLPGVIGAVGSALLRGVTPAVARRAITTAAGISLATGLMCTTAAAATPAMTASPAMTSWSAPQPLSTQVQTDPPHRSGHDADHTSDAPDLPTGAPALPDLAWPRPGAAPLSGDPPGGPITATSTTPTTILDTADSTTAPTVVTVQPGDCLWSLAARHLPAGASIARIDAAWRAWYAANRTVIGSNPNLILPGQHLRVPESSEEHA